jgi:hypothetical protein
MLNIDVELVYNACQYPSSLYPDYLVTLHENIFLHNNASKRWENGSNGMGGFLSSVFAASCALAGPTFGFSAAIGTGVAVVGGSALFAATKVTANQFEKNGLLAGNEREILTCLLDTFLLKGNYSRYALVSLRNAEFDAHTRGSNATRDKALEACIISLRHHHLNPLMHDLQLFDYLYPAYRIIKDDNLKNAYFWDSKTASDILKIINKIEQHYIHSPKKQLLDIAEENILNTLFKDIPDADILDAALLNKIDEDLFNKIKIDAQEILTLIRIVIDQMKVETVCKLLETSCGYDLEEKIKEMNRGVYHKISLFDLQSKALLFNKIKKSLSKKIEQARNSEALQYSHYLKLKVRQLDKAEKYQSNTIFSMQHMYSDLEDTETGIKRCAELIRQNSSKSETANALEKMLKEIQIFKQSLLQKKEETKVITHDRAYGLKK